jgi:membrane protein
MAFYVLISIAPLSVIAVGLVGRVLGEAEVREYVVDTSARLFDAETAELLSEILATPWVRRSGPVGNLSAILMLVWGVLRGRAVAFLVVLVFGATILASLALRTALVAFSSLIEVSGVTPKVPLALLAVIEILLLLAILTVLFALVYRILPDRKLPWRPLFVGASTTSLLFLVGEWLIGQYLGRVSLASAFGAAGSTVVLAAWVYYSSMVFFFGAALTCVYTEQRTGEVFSPEGFEAS